MTANLTRTGILALGLLMILTSTGCPDDSDLISSGNVVASMPANAVNPSGIVYECISIDYLALTVKPTDGICSADSDNPGRPCGTNVDCTTAVTDCQVVFGSYCNGGLNDLASCNNNDDCTGGECQTAGECLGTDDMFTGQPCFDTADCDIALGEVCGGECAPGSPLVGQPCGNDNDCSVGECIGGQASDPLSGSSVVVLTTDDDAVAYFTPQCPRCSLDTTIAEFCTSDADCENECVPAADIALDCDTPMCCEKPVRTTTAQDPCTSDADCVPNTCVDFWKPLPMSVLPEGRYDITAMSTKDLRMFAPGAVREKTSCISQPDIAVQFDPPLNFTVGPGLSNDIRSVIDIQALESILGTGIVAQCTDATENYPAWFQIVSE